MTNKNALAIKDQELIDLLSGMKNRSDGGGESASVPVLKINYDPDSKHPRGVWVLGQTKDKNGNIVEEGVVIENVAVLTVRHRYSYYNQNDTNANCNSPFFVQSPGVYVRGSKYGYVCGKGCPYREEGRIPRCKAQIVYFLAAFTNDGKMIECVAYMGGASYMAAADYAKMISTVRLRTPSGMIEPPPFAFVTHLGSEKKKNQGTTYWEATLRIGDRIESADHIVELSQKRAGAYEYIDSINSVIEGKKATPAQKPQRPTPESVNVTPIDRGASRVEDVEDIDDSALPPWQANTALDADDTDDAAVDADAEDIVGNFVSADTDAEDVADTDADYDITAAIAEALNRK